MLIRGNLCRPLCRCRALRAGCCSPSEWTWSRCRRAVLLLCWCGAPLASCSGLPPSRYTPGTSGWCWGFRRSHSPPPTEKEERLMLVIMWRLHVQNSLSLLSYQHIHVHKTYCKRLNTAHDYKLHCLFWHKYKKHVFLILMLIVQ